MDLQISTNLKMQTRDVVEQECLFNFLQLKEVDVSIEDVALKELE